MGKYLADRDPPDGLNVLTRPDIPLQMSLAMPRIQRFGLGLTLLNFVYARDTASFVRIVDKTGRTQTLKP